MSCNAAVQMAARTMCVALDVIAFVRQKFVNILATQRSQIPFRCLTLCSLPDSVVVFTTTKARKIDDSHSEPIALSVYCGFSALLRRDPKAKPTQIALGLLRTGADRAPACSDFRAVCHTAFFPFPHIFPLFYQVKSKNQNFKSIYLLVQTTNKEWCEVVVEYFVVIFYSQQSSTLVKSVKEIQYDDHFLMFVLLLLFEEQKYNKKYNNNTNKLRTTAASLEETTLIYKYHY